MTTRKQRDAARRWSIEREQELRDLEEDYDATTDPDERHRLNDELAVFRRAYRQEAIRRGKRTAGTGVAARTIWWLPWSHVAVESELRARQAYSAIVAGRAEALVDDLRASLVATTAAASIVEALVEDIRYLIPEQVKPKNDTTADENARILDAAFGTDDARLRSDLTWLAETRHSGVHPFSELSPTEFHPSGTKTSSEHAVFNANECGRAVDIAFHFLAIAQNPPNPNNRWIRRWVGCNESCFVEVKGLRARRAASPMVKF